MNKEKLQAAKNDQLEKNDRAKKQQLEAIKREESRIEQLKSDTISQIDDIINDFNSLFTNVNSIIKNLSDDILQEILEDIIRKDADKESDKLEIRVAIEHIPELLCETKWRIDEQWLKNDYKNNHSITDYLEKEFDSYEEFRDYVFRDSELLYENTIYSLLNTYSNHEVELVINNNKIKEIKFNVNSLTISASYFGHKHYVEEITSGNELIVENWNYVIDYLKEKGYDKFYDHQSDKYINSKTYEYEFYHNSTIFINIFNNLNDTIQKRLQDFDCKILSDKINIATNDVYFIYTIKNPLMDED